VGRARKILILRLLLVFVFSIFVFSQESNARVYDLYRADYPKGAFCSVIAGACTSDTHLESAFFQNPASLTAEGSLEHDGAYGFDGDYNRSDNLEPGMKGNNNVNESQFMGGLGYRKDRWGVGLGIFGHQENVNSQVTVVDSQNLTHNFGLQTSATIIEFNLPLAYRISDSLSLGFSLYGTSYSEAANPASGLNFGFTLGAIDLVNSQWTIGSWFRSPVTNYTTIQLDTQAYSTTLQYEEDFALHSPWIFANGVSFKPWNDTREFLFDLDVIGNTYQGYLLTYDTFSTAVGDSRLRAKGRNVVAEPRLGYRMPYANENKGTLFFGSYLETSRWDGLPSRIHGTGGIAYKTLDWLELMVGADVASSFFQLFLTFR
jgi:hypothetical protein